MAKRKRSTALFEVISKSRQYRPARPATARSGNWLTHAATWFVRPKFNPIVPSGQIGQVAHRAVAAQEMEYDEPQVTLRDPDDAHDEEPAVVATRAEVVKYEAPPSVTHRDIAVPAPSPSPSPSSSQSPAAPANVHVAVDSDQRQISLNVSYTAAAAIGLGLVAVLCSAVMIGQKMSHGSLPMLAQTSTDELRRGPAHREVLDPPTRRPSTAAPAGRMTPVDPKVTPRVVTHEADVRPAAGTIVPQVPTAAATEKRAAGFNYVVVQSYPKEEQEMADKAAAFLNSHGVNCTVEKDVKGFLAISVVGLDGFSKISSAEFKAYVDHVRKLSGEFTSNSRSFKAFDPRAKKW